MNIQRTPPQRILTSVSGSVSDSVPNLLAHSDDESYTKVNLRKRKERTEEYNYKRDFESFRIDIMKCLEGIGSTQIEQLNQIREEVVEIKNEIKIIKITTENFTKQFQQINSEIQLLKSTNSNTQEKIQNMEMELVVTDETATH